MNKEEVATTPSSTGYSFAKIIAFITFFLCTNQSTIAMLL